MYFSPKTSADGLVFHYDTGNTVRSYLGEPTVNTVGQLNSFNPLDLYTWITGGHQMTISRDASVKSPVGGTVLKAVTSGTSAYGGSYNSSGYNIAAASVGQTWTMSIYIKAPVGSNPSIMLFEANSSGNYTALSQQFITPTGEWQRLSVTRTLNQATTAYVQGRFDMYTSGVTVYYDGLQFEQKSRPTQFTAGTRSATQGLKDLTAANTINLSNVSFDANAQMTFDGTNDTVSIPSNSSNNIAGDITMELVLNRTAGYSAAVMHKEQQYTLYVYSSGAITYADSSIWSYSTFGAFGNLTTGTYHHLVATKTGGVVKIYLDGTVIINKSFGSAITQTNNTLYVGSYDGSSNYFGGDIPVAKVYNRALTADEVARNYNAIKSRFNIG